MFYRVVALSTCVLFALSRYRRVFYRVIDLCFIALSRCRVTGLSRCAQVDNAIMAVSDFHMFPVKTAHTFFVRIASQLFRLKYNSTLSSCNSCFAKRILRLILIVYIT